MAWFIGQPGEELLPRSPFRRVWFHFSTAFTGVSRGGERRKHYAIAPRREENSVVFIGYILCAVVQCNLGARYTYFFDIMIYLCDRFVRINRSIRTTELEYWRNGVMHLPHL